MTSAKNVNNQNFKNGENKTSQKKELGIDTTVAIPTVVATPFPRWHKG